MVALHAVDERLIGRVFFQLPLFGMQKPHSGIRVHHVGVIRIAILAWGNVSRNRIDYILRVRCRTPRKGDRSQYFRLFLLGLICGACSWSMGSDLYTPSRLGLLEVAEQLSQ